MSSSHPPDLAVSTAKLRAKLDSLATALGERPHHRPVSAHSLAGTIRKDNEARAERTAAVEEQENARLELLIACDAIRARYDDNTEVSLFQEAVREFLTALGAATPQRRIDALQAMRESVESMNRYRTGVR